VVTIGNGLYAAPLLRPVLSFGCLSGLSEKTRGNLIQSGVPTHLEKPIMTVQAPAILDVRASGFGAGSRIAAWLRGITVRQVRLACGLVMFSYIFSHFFDHALGNISYPVMEAWLGWHIWWWPIPLVNGTLYTAAVIHFSLGLWALYQRATFVTPQQKSFNSYSV
jgi:hypothetical protein